MTAFITIIVTIALFIFSGFIPGPREWWRSVFRQPFIASIILLCIISVFLGNPQNIKIGSENTIDAVRFARIVLLCSLSCLALITISFYRNPSPMGWGIKFMALYALTAMGSCFYSPFPLLSLWKGMEILALTITGMMIAVMLKEREAIQDILNTLYLACWYFVLSSLVGALFQPAQAFPKMKLNDSMAFALAGIYPYVNPNTLSQLSSIVCVISLIWILNKNSNVRSIGHLPVFLLSFGCLLLSHSRTSIAAMLLVCLLILFYYQKIWAFLILLWFGILFGVSGLMANYFMPYILRGQTHKAFATMTGRMTFWPEVMELIKKAPFLGHGFYASQRVTWHVSSVDNMYLEVLLGVGFIGLSIFLLPVFSVYRNLWKIRPWKFRERADAMERFLWIQLSSMFIIIVIRSFTGPSFQNLHINLVIFIILVISAYRLQSLQQVHEHS